MHAAMLEPRFVFVSFLFAFALYIVTTYIVRRSWIELLHTFCRVSMFALPLRPKRLQGSFQTVLRRFQAFLFVGYTFALFRAFRFIVSA